MKKLKLKLDESQMLNKDQMKHISGGYRDICYLVQCPDQNPAVYCYDNWDDVNNWLNVWNNFGGCQAGIILPL